MNILVTGANGQLGNELRFVSQGARDSYFFSDLDRSGGHDTIFLDITDIDSVRKLVREKEIRTIVNCAAFTNVDAAELHQELAERVNAKGPAVLAQVMSETGGCIVHISTDYVFGGSANNEPCREELPAVPCGVYGATKLLGEQNVIAAGGYYFIIRTSWLYSEFGKNFCKTMLALTASKERLKVVFDQCGTPTYALDLARAIRSIIESPLFTTRACGGIYHYSNEGVCSWYDFAKMVASYSGHSACDIQPCHSSEYPSPVKRPAYSVLDKSKIKRTFDLRIPYWADSLKECVNRLHDREQ